MSSITFEPPIPSCPVSSMLLDSNKGNTCSASTVSSQMYYNNNAIFTSQQTHHHNISPLVYTNMACSTTGGESSTTSSVSSSHTRLQQFDNSDLPNSEMMFNPNISNDQYKTEDGEDLEPISRDRCNTWPMRRPVVETQTSPLIHEQIPEEDSLYGSGDQLHEQQQSTTSQQAQQYNSNSAYNNNQSNEEENDQFLDDMSPGAEIGESGNGKKSVANRRNAWGNLSYADLITQAILSSPEQRLTLSQVYEWMIQNVPYFSNKGDSNSSAGWKNSIRHNLSLHNRFMRIQNEGAGKSSWWCINPEAKPGRNPRRRAATMESSTKSALDKKRRGARKRLEVGGICGSSKNLSESVTGSQLSMTSQDMYNDGNDDSLGPDFERFRARTQSNVSIQGKSSPHYDDFEYPTWGNTNGVISGSLGSQLGPINSNVNDLLNRTDQMRLDSVDAAPSEFCPTSNPMKGTLQPRQSPLQITLQNLKQEEGVKQEPMVMQQPPSYQEVIQNQGQMRPLIHSQIQTPQMMPNSGAQTQFYQTSVYNMPPQMINQQPINGQSPMTSTISMSNQTPMNQQPLWSPMQSQPLPTPQQIIYSQGQQFGQSPVLNGAGMMMGNGRLPQLPQMSDIAQPDLPNDLTNLDTLDSQFFMDTDIESIMKTL